ncbi:MAG TPA: Clp protease N-terminal domain-containing protein, partial [Rhabdochlamydiaceae bacterium]|nr:Clp protease N-terminal domain-containing protein [Rhabdochlamydiaceae bacterium]
MAPQFTEAVAQAFEQAFQYAQGHHHTEIGENHLLFAFFSEPKGYFQAFASANNLNVQDLLSTLEFQLKKVPVFSGPAQQPAVSQSMQMRIAEAQTIAKKWNDAYISSDHFLLAFWQQAGEPFASWKKGSSLSVKEVEARI